MCPSTIVASILIPTNYKTYNLRISSLIIVALMNISLSILCK